MNWMTFSLATHSEWLSCTHWTPSSFFHYCQNVKAPLFHQYEQSSHPLQGHRYICKLCIENYTTSSKESSVFWSQSWRWIWIVGLYLWVEMDKTMSESTKLLMAFYSTQHVGHFCFLLTRNYSTAKTPLKLSKFYINKLSLQGSCIIFIISLLIIVLCGIMNVLLKGTSHFSCKVV